MSNNTVPTNQLATEKIGKLLKYSLPAIIGTVVMSLYNIVDRIFIGQGVGPLAHFWSCSYFSMDEYYDGLWDAYWRWFGLPGYPLLLGQNDKDKAETILGNSVVLTFLISGSAIILSLIFMRDLLFLFEVRKIQCSMPMIIWYYNSWRYIYSALFWVEQYPSGFRTSAFGHV